MSQQVRMAQSCQITIRVLQSQDKPPCIRRPPWSLISCTALVLSTQGAYSHLSPFIRRTRQRSPVPKWPNADKAS